MTDTRERIETVLAQHTDDYRVLRELHCVPPHTTWEVRFEGRRAVCKLATSDDGDPATEACVIAFVGRRTDLPVPEVLGVGPDHFVAGWLDGVPGDDPRADEVWARVAGRTMARLHEATAGRFDRTDVPRPADGAYPEQPGGVTTLALDGRGTWADTVAAVLDDRRAFLDERGTEAYAAVAGEACAFVRSHPEAVPAPDAPVLCHGNLLPAHLGVGPGAEPVALIDFEHALVGHPAYDYWRTALPAFHASERPYCERAFREGYRAVRPLPAAVDRDADCFRLVNTVSYLRSLFLQDQYPPEEARRRADWLAAHGRETLADLRERHGE